MKKLCYSACLMVFSVLLITSCSDGTIGDTFAEDQYQAQGTVVDYSNVVNGFFDIGDPSSSFVGFDLTGFEGETPNTVAVVAAFNGTEVEMANVPADFPTSLSVAMPDLLSALGIGVDDVAVGDNVAMFLDATAASGTYRSSNVLNVPFSCFSGLAGMHPYASTNLWCGNADVTGTVEIIEISSGVYTFDDWSFGAYNSCYDGFTPANWGSLNLNDVCNKLSVSGLDNYDDTWTFVIDSVDGPELTISWSNTYGEAGTATITNASGEDWPPLSI